jgi:pimeloyl-ACP methyl ester carboxylesterase
MRRWIACFFVIIAIYVQANAAEYDIHPSIRFTLERKESSSPIVYYFSLPDVAEQSYPILIICDGSESKGSERSVFFVRDFFTERVRALNVGYVSIEKCGIDGNEVNQAEFWTHYTRSQRLKDHIQVIRHLEEHPPAGWNGKFIFVGVSEGGPLVTDLSIMCPNTIATINWSGAGDWSWADELWQFFDHWKKNSFWIRLYDAIPRWVPFSSDIPAIRPEFDALVQEIIVNPTPDLWMGGMTYLYHADAFQKPPIDYSKIKTPFLVVAGAEDSIIDSCDQFVQKGLDAGAPITYFRVDGMDHYIRKRPDIIDQSFEWLKLQLSLGESSK